ncbi:hypothetical protein MCOR27_007086 [Pyricularia oryzae]|uniref:ABC transporter n=2 Tax=Pyricularia TaxID=48558 RepID=A0ABQ8NP78_PYRGI|nr:hypothetical protein MCOR01_002367 [Pyricularia oryzae]KAI6300043.1 hypothetical protein MCOR33_004153 [Pyricularia grisea]KAI6256675.1 hypothetical protein MCOR19_006860 [Pyricularia oryzae]KAI6267696.1 hypothetical protein MCOR26_009572 [Pyricularia oryzae]KAI6275227.1 hypothetical protein MCOR27_007086 [Pyricularia oryzae]
MDTSGYLEASIAVAGLSLITALSTPAIKNVAIRSRSIPGSDSTSSSLPYVEAAGHVYLYEDKDGKATEQSMAEFSDFWPRIFAWTSAVAGLGMSITASVLSVGRSGASGSEFGMFLICVDAITWTMLCLQCATLPVKHQYQRRYKLSLYALVTSTVLFASLVTRFGGPLLEVVKDARKTTESGATITIAVSWFVQMLAAIVAMIAFSSFPQRPDVYHDGRLVDQQNTASLIRRMGYAWNKVVFVVAKERQLTKADLPDLDFTRRSKNVNVAFLAQNFTGRLWRQLIVAHWGRLAQQWALSFTISALALFPQYVLYNFLEILEKPRRDDGNKFDPTLIAWVFSLFVSLLLQVWVNNTMRWLTYTRLEQPVLQLLQSLVFQKAMRLKETASPPTKSEGEGKDKDQIGSGSTNKSAGPDTRQSIVNHMKLDSNRTTMFSNYNYQFPVAIIKLALSGTFLVQLMGFKAVVAGMSSSLVVLPITHLLSKRYAKIQFGLMKYRDAKANLLTEALQGMRQIRFSALEKHWEDKILKSRSEELAQYWKVMCWAGLTMIVINTGPLLLSSVTLSVYALTTTNGIKASVVFASLGLFDQLEEAISYLPLLQVYLMEAWTSCVRLEKYFAQPDRQPISTTGDHISFENATVAWPKFEEVEGENTTPFEERSLLRNVTLDFPNGALSIISGKTGSGKSLLLAAILGEVTLVSGTIHTPPIEELTENLDQISDAEWIIPNLTAFVPQTPWIETGTVKDNILFGLPLNHGRYSKVIAACALEKDLELLVDGDSTEVGPKGVTLSGGQRWRVALARALYSRAGIVILDDVLSAVDAHVGRIIVDQALTGELARGRTRILATHHAEMCLPRASYFVRLDDGRLEHTEKLTPEAPEPISRPLTSSDETASHAGSSSDNTTAAESAITSPEESDDEQDDAKKKPKKKGLKEEGRARGRVKWKVYKDYFQAGKAVWLWALSIALILLGRMIAVGRTWSLKELSESDPSPSSALAAIRTTSHLGSHDYAHLDGQVYIENPRVDRSMSAQGLIQDRPVAFWIGVYILLEITVVLVSVCRMLVFTAIGLRTARVLFQRMTHRILRAPLRWIDNTPSGRILNRFTSDMFSVDRRVAMDLGQSMSNVLQVLTIIAASLSVSKYVNLFGLALLILYVQIASEYISAAREVKRLNSVVWSPIYDQFSSVLNGLSTIRGFGRTSFYTDRMYELIDTATKTQWALALCQRWMAFRMGVLGVLFVTVVAGAVAFGRVDAALAGFSLTFALGYTSALTALLQNMASIELGFNATERVLEYGELETEPEGGQDAPAAWPTQGRIEVENLTVAYAEDLPPVLKNLTFTVEAGERVGIIGRTGAGKSTLASVLFRLLEPREGSVRIDNIDIAKLNLEQLRSRLAIIPQDPFLFSGTLRSNLDMEDEMDDYELLTALQRVHLIKPAEPVRPSAYAPAASPSAGESEDDTLLDASDENGGQGTETPSETGASSAFKDLSTPISTGGSNLSQGQRQLVCLARALLARPKIVVLDEATSAVDRTTDAAIQESIREDFSVTGCTVFVIAHRLSTVADFDKILVLKEGRVAQMGTPGELLKRGMNAAAAGGIVDSEETDETAFWDLVKKSSEKEKLIEMILGEAN